MANRGVFLAVTAKIGAVTPGDQVHKIAHHTDDRASSCMYPHPTFSSSFLIPFILDTQHFEMLQTARLLLVDLQFIRIISLQ